VTYPFGKLVLRCGCKPTLVGPPANDWEPSETTWLWAKECHRRQCKYCHISFDAAGEIYNTKYATCPRKYDKCGKLKDVLFRKGFVSQTDANYVALSALRQFPRLAKYIVYRFPILMVDEAQDSSDVQMSIVDTLIAAGLKEVMLIGDPYQAIFEWRKARPDLFRLRYGQWESVVLNESFRSSQNICDLVDTLSSVTPRTVSRNQEASNLGIMPEILAYEPDQASSLVSTFVKRCKNYNIEPEEDDLVVLTRGRTFVRELVGIRAQQEIDPWNDKFTHDLCVSRCLFVQNKWANACRRLERAICGLLMAGVVRQEDVQKAREEYGFSAWRKDLHSLLSRLPSTDCRLSDWVAAAQSVVNSCPLIPNAILKIKRNSAKCKYGDLAAADIVEDTGKDGRDNNYRWGTVHSVKGESCDAVMLVLKTKAANKRKYISMLNDDLLDNEEMRIVYVALSRARKAVFLAVPMQDKDQWEKRLLTSPTST